MTPARDPYVRLAAAILIQAARDAAARRVTKNRDSSMPTAADVTEAREFLISPAGLHLAAGLGLHPGYVQRLASRPTDAAGPIAGWLTVAEVARRFRYHPERVRWLIRAGRVEAVRSGRRQGWRVNPASVAAYRAQKD